MRSFSFGLDRCLQQPVRSGFLVQRRVPLQRSQESRRLVEERSQQIFRADRRCIATDAHLAPQFSIPEQKVQRQAILLQKFKGHNATVTSVLVTGDTENAKEIVTASLDKSVTLWELPATDGDEPSKVVEKTRITPDGSPAFSLVQEPPSHDTARRTIFCGIAAKSVVTWDLREKAADKKVKLNGHTGWVRALATNRRWLFSAGCNKIAQWDLSRSVPRKFNEISLFTGDVQVIMIAWLFLQGLSYGDGRLFSCGADGSIHSWTIGKKGELEQGVSREKAHKDRVSACLYKKGFLYTVSLDGSVKMWSAQNLELVESVKNAHNGKVHCLAAGPDGYLYTGGDDNLIRRWQLGSLHAADGSALYGHHYPVRALAAGPLETLVSADSSGEVAIWKI